MGGVRAPATPPYQALPPTRATRQRHAPRFHSLPTLGQIPNPVASGEQTNKKLSPALRRDVRWGGASPSAREEQSRLRPRLLVARQPRCASAFAHLACVVLSLLVSGLALSRRCSQRGPLKRQHDMLRPFSTLEAGELTGKGQAGPFWGDRNVPYLLRGGLHRCIQLSKLIELNS